MKIRAPLVTIRDQLITFIAEGYAIIGDVLSRQVDEGVVGRHDDWKNKVHHALLTTFPTAKEAGQFMFARGTSNSYPGFASAVAKAVDDMDREVTALETILETLDRYYEFEPDSSQLFVQAIDSFKKVRDVNHQQVQGFLKDAAC